MFIYITSFFSSGHGSQGGQIVCYMMCIVLKIDHQQIDNIFFEKMYLFLDYLI